MIHSTKKAAKVLKNYDLTKYIALFFIFFCINEIFFVPLQGVYKK